MKKQDLNTALNYMPMDLVENFAETHDKLIKKMIRRKTLSRLTAIAACACLLISVSLISALVIGKVFKSPSDTHSNKGNENDDNSIDDPMGITPPDGSEGTGTSGDEENRVKTMYMTVANTRPSCMAIETSHPDYGSCFFAYGEDGRFYCVPWKDVDVLSEKAYVKIDYTNVKIIEYPDGKPTGGYTADYLMTATKVETVCSASTDPDYGKLVSFATAVEEYKAKDYYSPTNIKVALYDYDLNYLSVLCSDLSTWVDDSCIDREEFYFKGRIRVAAGDTVEWLYFALSHESFDRGTWYYNGYFTSINEEDAKLLERIMPIHPDSMFDTDWIGFSSSEVSSKILRLNENDRQSVLNVIGSSEKWSDGVHECDWIGIFTGPNIDIRYCDCGTIADRLNNRFRKVNEEEKAVIEPMIKRYNLYGNFNSFSYTDDLAKYKKGTPGVKFDGFNNITEAENPIYTASAVIERAKYECTGLWNFSKVYYDSELDVWKVLFYTTNAPGGDQSIYLNAKGKTLLIVYGE